MNENKKTVRVRFAPSPTGYLHIGGARTALYNWLFARKNNGVFILRIEDTDEVRSTEESLGGIIKSLKWLGLDWDEGPESFEGSLDTVSVTKYKGNYGPYFQMERFDRGIYQKYARQLLDEGRAYYCYCTREELEKMRGENQQAGYNGRCSRLSAQEREKYEQEGRPKVVRFKMPREGKTEFNDIVRGAVSFENALQNDFVMLKANGIPTYNYVCVIDDHLMEITHVIRGDDHLSNTPKQLLIYKAFGWQLPEFAHLSMILGPDGSRLSKRHGATSVMEYEKMGYLSETLRNYLALLGWSTENSQQLFGADELIREFSLERCSGSAAKFDPDRLLWMNGEYIRGKTKEELYREALKRNFLDEGGLKDEPKEIVTEAIGLVREKFRLLSEIPGHIDFLVKDNINYREADTAKVLAKPGVRELLADIKGRFQGTADFRKENLETALRDYSTEKGLKTSAIFHPLRVAVSGRTVGPGLFEILEFLGKEKVIRRIDYTLENILK
jgi:nondiscriminating glutamyl-tRNA synthetase